MLRYFKVPFILTVIFISLAIITNTFTYLKFVDFVIAFCIAALVSFFVEYPKIQSKYLLFFRKYF